MEKTTNTKPEKITIKDTISYEPIHKDYGRAEFVFCPIFKEGIMKRLYIYALQQERKIRRWILKIDIPVTTFHIESWAHKTNPPHIWREFWCKQHKTISHEVYVPDNTNKITFSYFFGNSLSIRFE